MSKRVEPFWVMAVEHDPNDIINSKIIIEPKVILAENEEIAKFMTTVELGVEGHTNIANIEVFVTIFSNRPHIEFLSPPPNITINGL